jgi:ATP-dependent Clp protease ATP-binding subunit ClpC
LPFSVGARPVLTLAHEESFELDHTFIGTEHLMLALVRFDPVLAGVLEQHGVSRSRLLDTLHVIYSEAMPVASEVHLTPRAQAAVHEGVEAARRMQAAVVNPIHLMLGVLADGEGVVAGIFAAYGLDRWKVADDVIASQK